MDPVFCMKGLRLRISRLLSCHNVAGRARTRVSVPSAAALELWAFMPGGHSEQHRNSTPRFQDSGFLSLLSQGGGCSEQAGHGPAVPVGPTGEMLHLSFSYSALLVGMLKSGQAIKKIHTS